MLLRCAGISKSGCPARAVLGRNSFKTAARSPQSNCSAPRSSTPHQSRTAASFGRNSPGRLKIGEIEACATESGEHINIYDYFVIRLARILNKFHIEIQRKLIRKLTSYIHQLFISESYKRNSVTAFAENDTKIKQMKKIIRLFI